MSGGRGIIVSRTINIFVVEEMSMILCNTMAKCDRSEMSARIMGSANLAPSTLRRATLECGLGRQMALGVLQGKDTASERKDRSRTSSECYRAETWVGVKTYERGGEKVSGPQDCSFF